MIPEKWKKMLSSPIDKKFGKNYGNYIGQSLLIFACISIISLMYELVDGITVASLGASSFILFVSPHTNSSRFRYVAGGYVCGAVMGILMFCVRHAVEGMDFYGQNLVLALVGGLAVAATTFLMIVINCEHPPAAALALGLSMDPSCLQNALTAMVCVLILCGVRRLLRKRLKDLL